MLLLDLTPLALAYCGFVLLLNFTLRGSLGFGAALGLPLLAFVIPVKVLAPAWSLIAIVSSAAIVGRGRRHVDRREYLRILPGCALGVAAGLFFFKTFDEALLARALGVFIILYAAYSFWMTTGAEPPIRPGVLRPAASFLSGAVGTLFGGLAGVFFAVYLDAGGIGKHALRATLSAMLMTLSVVRTIGYAAVGELTADAFILCAAAAPAMVVGLLVGDRIHTGLSQVAFQRLVCAALALCGAALLFSS